MVQNNLISSSEGSGVRSTSRSDYYQKNRDDQTIISETRTEDHLFIAGSE